MEFRSVLVLPSWLFVFGRNGRLYTISHSFTCRHEAVHLNQVVTNYPGPFLMNCTIVTVSRRTGKQYWVLHEIKLNHIAFM